MRLVNEHDLGSGAVDQGRESGTQTGRVKRAKCSAKVLIAARACFFFGRRRRHPSHLPSQLLDQREALKVEIDQSYFG